MLGIWERLQEYVGLSADVDDFSKELCYLHQGFSYRANMNAMVYACIYNFNRVF